MHHVRFHVCAEDLSYQRDLVAFFGDFLLFAFAVFFAGRFFIFAIRSSPLSLTRT